MVIYSPVEYLLANYDLFQPYIYFQLVALILLSLLFLSFFVQTIFLSAQNLAFLIIYWPNLLNLWFHGYCLLKMDFHSHSLYFFNFH